MRIGLAAVLNRKRGEYKIAIRLFLGRDEAGRLSPDAALDLSLIAYGNATAMLAERTAAAGAAGRPMPKYVHVESSDTREMPAQLTSAIADLLGEARTVRPNAELEQVRGLLRTALATRYAALGIVPPAVSIGWPA